MNDDDLANVTMQQLQAALITLTEIRTMLIGQRFDVDLIHSVSDTVQLVDKAVEYKKYCRAYDDVEGDYERAMKVIG